MPELTSEERQTHRAAVIAAYKARMNQNWGGGCNQSGGTSMLMMMTASSMSPGQVMICGQLDTVV